VSLNGAQRGCRKEQLKGTYAGKNEDARGNARREHSETLEKDRVDSNRNGSRKRRETNETLLIGSRQGDLNRRVIYRMIPFIYFIVDTK
jgi:hypothetical protein